MDAMRRVLPRLQLTVPMPMKTEKVGLTFRRFDVYLHDGKDRKSAGKFLKGSLRGCAFTFFLSLNGWSTFIQVCVFL